MSVADHLRMQSLATCNNYYHTGQYRKAISVLNQFVKLFPDDVVAKTLMDSICRSAFSLGDFFVLDGAPTDNGLSEVFGKNWAGEPLNNSSIMIFCDQGMGDTIQMLRYTEMLKRTYDCTIYLNCYAYYNEMVSLMDHFSAAQFVKEHIKTDFHTNILSIASISNGLDYECHYPAHHKALLGTQIPQSSFFEDVTPCLEGGVGLAWKSNAKNPLSQNKSIELELFNDVGVDFHNLLPEQVEGGFLIEREPVVSLLDTAQRIAGLDLVISVDTAVLHLAGVMNKPVWGLLCKEPDPRWGEEERTPWYPQMRLFRQTEEGNWVSVIQQVKQELVKWYNQK